MGKSLWIEGLSDAIGFVGGALLGFLFGQLLGVSIFNEGYGIASMAGIVLVGLGGGGGLQLARSWRKHRKEKEK